MIFMVKLLGAVADLVDVCSDCRDMVLASKVFDPMTEINGYCICTLMCSVAENKSPCQVRRLWNVSFTE